MISQFAPKQGLLGIKVPFAVVLLIIGVAVLGTKWYFDMHASSKLTIDESSIDSSKSSQIVFTRKHQYGLTSPLLLSDLSEESANLFPLKDNLNSIIQTEFAAGNLTNCSVFVRRFKDGNWIGINQETKYNPGSMGKLPVLITILKQNEMMPGFLNKKASLSPNDKTNVNPVFTDQEIIVGKQYTIKELCQYMIERSSNNAVVVLSRELNMDIFKGVFADLGLTVPDFSDRNYKMDVTGISKMMRILYNSTYLNAEDSEFALSLLTKSTFKDGIIKNLPADIKVAHKFGEQGNQDLKQLHETAIIYLNDSPYLITVMSQGKDFHNLSAILANLSLTTYNFFKAAS